MAERKSTPDMETPLDSANPAAAPCRASSGVSITTMVLNRRSPADMSSHQDCTRCSGVPTCSKEATLWVRMSCNHSCTPLFDDGHARTGIRFTAHPTMRSRPGNGATRPDTTTPKTTSSIPAQRASTNAHAA